MKGLVILSVLLFAGAAYALPIEVEEIVEKKENRWELIPDGDGRFYLVDLSTLDSEAVDTFFNPANDVEFWLHTRRSVTVGQRLLRTTASVAGSQWNSAQSYRFVCHGWNNNHNSPVNVQVQRGLLARADHNVIRIGWGGGAQNPNYLTSRNHVNGVGAAVASYADWLHQNGFIQAWNRVHCIGHSLGAHICGAAGKRTTRGRFQAIFGMDPAGPMFSMGDAANRLAANDAVYTEMIATNAGVLGFDQPICQANFYPNWGSLQPGCGVDIGGSCSHSVVVPKYEESINSARFVARRCANYAQIQNRNCPTGQGTATMGGDVSRSLSGVFFLETNANSPHARG